MKEWDKAICNYESVKSMGEDNKSLRISLSRAFFGAEKYAEAINGKNNPSLKTNALPVLKLFAGLLHILDH